MVSTHRTSWRAAGPYLPTLASKAALLEETRLFLLTYGQNHDLQATSQILLNTLVQRSHRTRTTILSIIRARFVRWNPPDWVLQDLVSFAQGPDPDVLRASLYLHVSRQDHLLYDFVQQVIVPMWHNGTLKVIISDVQTFLDESEHQHPEIAHWSFETRLRLSRGILATLRDYGLLKGETNKQIILPTIPDIVTHHLISILRDEGIPNEQMAHHPDWRLWLWSPAQAEAAIKAFFKTKY